MNALELIFASMTVGELAARSNISVAQLVEVAFSGRGSSQSKATTVRTTTSTPVASSPASRGKIARGGLSLDHVLAAVGSVGGPAKLEDVRARTGGTVPQVRAALQKLAGAKKIAITGQRRGTRYTTR